MNKDFWSKTLKEKGLESPGRDKAVRKTLEKIAEKKSLEEARRLSKTKGTKNK